MQQVAYQVQPQPQHPGSWGAAGSPAPTTSVACPQKCVSRSQASGASPSSQASSMEYADMPASPDRQHGGHSSSFTDADCCAGWFAKCRGCGCMTAHEQPILGQDVPFCRRCQFTLAGACPVMQAKMRDTLLYVHTAWSKAGL